MSGKACIRGLRVTVSLVLNLVANGMSTEEIIGAYPFSGTGGYPADTSIWGMAAEEAVHPIELTAA
jgi:hypothetical protein